MGRGQVRQVSRRESAESSLIAVVRRECGVFAQSQTTYMYSSTSQGCSPTTVLEFVFRSRLCAGRTVLRLPSLLAAARAMVGWQKGSSLTHPAAFHRAVRLARADSAVDLPLLEGRSRRVRACIGRLELREPLRLFELRGELLCGGACERRYVCRGTLL